MAHPVVSVPQIWLPSNSDINFVETARQIELRFGTGATTCQTFPDTSSYIYVVCNITDTNRNKRAF